MSENRLSVGPPEGAREHWGSRWGFILASVGSAAGLGNIWRFSYIAGENGGAAFLIVYLGFVLFLGLPILIAELAIGRRAQGDAVAAFRTLAPGRPWVVAGVLGVVAAFIIMGFYSVVAGWALKYFVDTTAGALWRYSGEDFAHYFRGFIVNPYWPLVWQFLMIGGTVLVVAGGIQRGIEAASKVLMPIFVVLVFGLAGYSLTLQGAAEGISFLFAPDWQVFAKPDIYLAAAGQAFFSIGIGIAIFITYGSYLGAGQRIPGAAAVVVAGDTVIAVMAGAAIFPAVFTFGLDPGQGAELAFVTLPAIFAVMPGGHVIGPLFFFLLVIAALTSMLSILEVPVAYFTRRFGLGRPLTAVALGLAMFALGVPSALGFGVLSAWRWSGRGVLESMDYLASNMLLPVGATLIALFAGWGWRNALEESDLGRGAAGLLWLWLLRLLAPAVILLIFLRALGVL